MIKIKRQKITWIIEDSRIVACNKYQATSYNLLGSNSKKDLFSMKDELLKIDVGNNWVEVLELSAKHHLTGVSTRVNKEWLDGEDSILEKCLDL